MSSTISASREPQTIATQLIHGNEPNRASGEPLIAPIVQSTTYAQSGIGVEQQFTYSRCSNPTNSQLERTLGALENAPPAVCFRTGMAAITALFLSEVRSGDHVVCSDVVYGGTSRLLEQILEPLGVETTFVSGSGAQEYQRALRSSTKLIFVETPGNPSSALVDLRSLGALAQQHQLTLAVDNTFLTPALQNPLEWGATYSVYSTTKFIEGHGATLGGAVVTRDLEKQGRIRTLAKTLGAPQAPFESWLTLRGLKTLELRMKRHSESALLLAEWLEKHPKVKEVSYPGLSSHPQHQLAREQQRDFGGILSFVLKGSAIEAKAFARNLKLITLAENLGAAESILTHPLTMTHADVPADRLIRLGISPNTFRFSVGLEAPQDLIQDLDTALASLQDQHGRNS